MFDNRKKDTKTVTQTSWVMILLFLAQCLSAPQQEWHRCCLPDMEELAEEENVGNVHNALIHGSQEAREVEASDFSDEPRDVTALCVTFFCLATTILVLIFLLFANVKGQLFR
jgi:hypothetical protein